MEYKCETCGATFPLPAGTKLSDEMPDEVYKEMKAHARVHEREIAYSQLRVLNTACPKCGSTDFEMRGYNMAAHDGDIHCARCGTFIRVFDAG